MRSFGDIIKSKREENGLFLRQVSALMEIDQAIISKIERQERKASREQVLKFAEVFEINPDELIISWCSDKVAYELREENNTLEILKLAESKLKYLKTIKK
ncbi:MAG: helix-turn-helix transcriptional regulator [Bacteroidales bacterium]|jgi:ribosome-binding protein aMBF1 (putative translation factor)|nr:helix-turn-helix domain-containing protein [Bacteroidales bacterium]MDD2386523.1 helix-turn-helix transcriptional regulator [Bacteroidales bacterium]MDD4217150.1 helix-turn-helix transcriptional regulator [Bacteroidales bacterium]MDY0143285.1 helix-turn-helix transcriptional regulator [Bacteroidales bacterium]